MLLTSRFDAGIIGQGINNEGTRGYNIMWAMKEANRFRSFTSE